MRKEKVEIDFENFQSSKKDDTSERPLNFNERSDNQLTPISHERWYDFFYPVGFSLFGGGVGFSCMMIIIGVPSLFAIAFAPFILLIGLLPLLLMMGLGFFVGFKVGACILGYERERREILAVTRQFHQKNNLDNSSSMTENDPLLESEISHEGSSKKNETKNLNKRNSLPSIKERAKKCNLAEVEASEEFKKFFKEIIEDKKYAFKFKRINEKQLLIECTSIGSEKNQTKSFLLLKDQLDQEMKRVSIDIENVHFEYPDTEEISALMINARSDVLNDIIKLLTSASSSYFKNSSVLLFKHNKEVNEKKENQIEKTEEKISKCIFQLQ